MLLQEEELWQRILNWFPRSAAWMLIIGGFVALTWLGYERKRKKGFIRIKTEDWEETEVTKFLRVLSYTGIFLGIIIIWAAIIGMLNGIPPSFKYRDVTGNNYDIVTSVSCIVVGLVMFFKPVNDLPWAGIIGFFAGVAASIVIALNIPPSWMSNPNLKWYIIITGIVIASLVGVLVKNWIGVIQAISKILSYPPIALIVAVYCFVQGGMVLLLGYGLGNL
ncbi:MAG: hypothetical protein ACTSU2_16135 [Promethearchaeota archaeon]